MLETILFFLFGGLAIVAGIGMLSSQNPINSALWLILNFFCIASLYLMLNAQFIGIIQILVYAGAIMVLVLFVIMLLNLGTFPQKDEINWKKIAGFLASVGVLAFILAIVAQSFDLGIGEELAANSVELGDPKTLGKELFTRYALMVEVIGILLLAATVGAVLLAKKRLV